MYVGVVLGSFHVIAVLAILSSAMFVTKKNPIQKHVDQRAPVLYTWHVTNGMGLMLYKIISYSQ